MNLASVVERADEQVLPAVYFFVGKSLRATPAQLGTLTFARALVQVYAPPTQALEALGSHAESLCRAHNNLFALTGCTCVHAQLFACC